MYILLFDHMLFIVVLQFIYLTLLVQCDGELFSLENRSERKRGKTEKE